MSKNNDPVWEAFKKLNIKVGTIVEAKVFAEARKPAFRLKIDFGENLILNSSAQITDIYQASDLPGKQVVAIVNLKPKQIANLRSQCLILGVNTPDGVVLLQPERSVNNGLSIG